MNPKIRAAGLSLRGAALVAQVKTSGQAGGFAFKSRNRLSAMHFILSRLERNATEDASRLDPFCRTGFTMTDIESVFQDLIQGMLYAGETFGRIIIFIVYVQISLPNGIFYFFYQQIIVDKRLCRFTGKFHHHPGRRIRIHIGIFPGHLIRFRLYDFQKDIPGFRFTGHTTLIPVSNI